MCATNNPFSPWAGILCEKGTVMGASQTKRPKHPSFQARQPLLAGALPRPGQRRPGRVRHGRWPPRSVLEHSHRQYDGLLLGTGTSVNPGAMRELSKAGVLVGFCGGGGRPFISGRSTRARGCLAVPAKRISPTQYLQQWVRFWFRRRQAAGCGENVAACPTCGASARVAWESPAGKRRLPCGCGPGVADSGCGRGTHDGGAGAVTALLTEEARLTGSSFSWHAVRRGMAALPGPSAAAASIPP